MSKQVKKITDFSKQPAPVRKKKETVVSEMPSAIDNFEVWITDNWKFAVSALAVLIVIVLGLIVTNHIQNQAEQSARQEIASAGDIAALEVCVEKYKSNPAVVSALQRLAALYTGSKNYAKAYDTLRTVAGFEKADSFLRTRAALDCAGLLELQNNPDDALREFETIVNDSSVNESQRAEAACSAARICIASANPKRAEIFLATINLERAYSNPDDPYAVWAQKAADLKASLNAPASAGKSSAKPAAPAAVPPAKAAAPKTPAKK